MALVIQQVIQLLNSIAVATYGIGYLIHVLTEIPWAAIYEWAHTAPVAQGAPHLSAGNEVLYAQFQQIMDAQFQIAELKKTILSMPALPNEGY
ncbi:hypothetical protein [Bradyrhizobium sp. CCBAU 51627]|uniref:hypothetical protein n=1 Tax=Bradyrhizobium sp. CCBAU 51627 TaxID=1325088 RepID=UPI00230553BA|nr:hypothetical protein [Bradyrhizobium sp. CCBAU 51627]MDA9437052.1 hypothetical protein [Bradyrhizobium sp. CCBAU 51627]